MNIIFSLIICTRNRSGQLFFCLDSISAMDKIHEFELIIVDNGSVDDTNNIVKEFILKNQFRIIYHYEPKRGLSFARNSGLLIAKGEYIAFTDDDCYVDVDYIFSIMSPFCQDPSIGFVGGRVKLYDDNDLRVSLKDDTENHVLPASQMIVAGSIMGANFAFRRAALTDIFGFDTFLGAGTLLYSGEDTELVCRVSAKGWKGFYNSFAIVYHHHGRKNVEDVYNLKRGYDIGRGGYYMACLINSDIGIKALFFWYKNSKYKKIKIICREMYGAFLYLYLRIKNIFISND